MAGLSGRVVLITGAASALGRATATAFARHGAKLALVERTDVNHSSGALHVKNKMAKISAECKELGAPAVFFCQHDLAERDGVRMAVEEAMEEFKDQLNVLINNNALLHPEDAASASVDDDDHFESVLSDNIMAAVRFSQLCVPHLQRTTNANSIPGSIVNINGPDITVGPGALLAHKLCQGAMDELTRAMAIDLAPKNIRVNGIRAGGAMSLNGSEGMTLTLKHLDSALVDPEDMKTASGHHKAPQFGLASAGSSKDVANAVVHLSSDNSCFVTGQTLGVDGGASLCHIVTPFASGHSGSAVSKEDEA